jgi:hypothetical protein
LKLSSDTARDPFQGLAMRILNIVRAGVLLAAAAVLGGCNDDLTRSEAKRILDGPSRGSACQSGLQFLDGAFSRAKAAGILTFMPNESGLLGAMYKLADLPGGDRWQTAFLGFEKNPMVTRRLNRNLCLPGQVEITALAPVPFGPASDSYKEVDFVEVVSLPPELSRLAPYVYLRYTKKAVFQKTDNGWRVAQ